MDDSRVPLQLPSTTKSLIFLFSSILQSFHEESVRKLLIVFILPHKKYFGKFGKLHIFNKNNIFVVSALNVSFAQLKKVLPLVKDPGGWRHEKNAPHDGVSFRCFPVCERDWTHSKKKNLSFLAQSLRNDK